MNSPSQDSPVAIATKLIVVIAVVFISSTLAEPAFAQSSGAFAPLETAVQMIVDFI